MQAFLMADRGDASVEDIDIAMRLGAGYPLGPFELADVVGLDVNKLIGDGWAAKFPNDPTIKAPTILNDLVKKGHLGRKTGQGFYKYDSKGSRIPSSPKK